MKYGEQLEQESVPQWSLHNLDYNSLKHEIKVHTTRDQATAITIPGREDTALRKFEDGLYLELCRQHDRVDLFISSKADEISRRLESLARTIDKWSGKCSEDPTTSQLLKRQRRVAKYERELLRVGDDVHALSRFANAQIVAFRKIIKKYKKWTGSTTLGTRFKENVLNSPKSFTRRNYDHLRDRYQEILVNLRNTIPQLSEPSSPSSDERPSSSRPDTGNGVHCTQFEPLPPPSQKAEQDHRSSQSSQIKYWNEYDDGSEAGGPEDDYAIYIDPESPSVFPGLGYVQAVLGMPFEKAKHWFENRRGSEHEPLLGDTQNSRGYFTTTSCDSDEEADYASSAEFPARGYAAHYAFPSITDQKVMRYRENVLFWGTISCFATSFVLLGISSVLISASRHKLRVEVDATVTVGVALSLLCACSGLGMVLYRHDPLSLSHKIMVGSTFVAACLLNGMLLVLVVGNTP